MKYEDNIEMDLNSLAMEIPGMSGAVAEAPIQQSSGYRVYAEIFSPANIKYLFLDNTGHSFVSQDVPTCRWLCHVRKLQPIFF